MSVFLAANIWASRVNSYNSLVATRFVGGLFGGVIEALGPLIVSELFPEHQLARAMVVYVALLASGSAIGPIISGVIGTRLDSWQWFFRVCSIAIGVNLFTSILMLPETSFEGDWPADVTAPQNFNEKHASDGDIETVENALATESIAASSTVPSSGQFWTIWRDRSFFLPWNFSDIMPLQRSQLGVLLLFVEPWALLLTPPVFVTTVVFGLTIGWTVIISIVFSNVFQMPPHLWSAESIGLLNVSALIGIIVGLPIGGVVADKLSTLQTKRAGGAHNPRSRLPLLLVGGIISPTGLLVVGFCLRPQSFSWVGCGAGWAMLTFGLSASANVLLAYSVDCFRHKAGHVGVLVNVVKNCLGFGVSYASVEWYTKSGPVNQMGVMAGVIWAFYLLVLPLYFYHKEVIDLSRKIIA